MDKKELREHMVNTRNSMSVENKAAKDRNIFNQVIMSKYYIEAETIMTYVSFGSEVDTLCIIKHALENNKIVCVPKIINVSQGMKAIKIQSLGDLIKNKIGILEPVSFDNEIESKDIDLFLVPGLAFDKSGGRIGYGAGYYDRFLKASMVSSVKIGLAYDSQLIDMVPMTENDVYMNIVMHN
ncbi:5-formyltetrahydrofolate cyclo-ligase [Candidatus Clostridium radicumherbarum]|uniref:5-formyltetrahydrofolate cyclo-ligase n=1 Tax=Candidatus Clostridium radicumherbarum TaxID=3381662 RepID=A0ABW8TRZ9_9CLOT